MPAQKNSLIRDCLKQRILILDGATGTMLQSFHLEEKDYRGERFANHPIDLKGDNDVLNLTSPESCIAVHRMYLNAGADIITTNTFNCTRLSQKKYGMEAYCREIACAAARNAKKAAAEFTALTPDKPRFVAGDVGPTGKMLSMSADANDPGSRDVTFEEMAESYGEQIEGLLDGGADLILFETIFDPLNTKAGIYALNQIFEKRGYSVPVMISGTLSDASGRLLAGQNAEAFLYSVMHAPDLLSIGFNCALGAEEMHPHIAELAAKAPCFVSAHPNAGLPDASGNYTQTPQIMAQKLREFAEEGIVNIAGGCCGTNPDHIAAIAKALEGIAPRKPVVPAPALRLSGLDPLVSSPEIPFLNVGERTNVAGSRKFLNLIKAGDYTEGLRIARRQIENGARIIDVNMDDAMLDSVSCMRKFLLNLASEPEIARVPVMIDSSKWKVIHAGLECLQGKCIVNSISLKEGEEKFLEKAHDAKRFGAAVLTMAFDEQGQADSVERRVNVCRRMYHLLTEKANFIPSDIIFDVNVFAVATGIPEHDRCAADFIEAVRILKQEFPDCHFSGGISNVSFSFRGNDTVRSALHCVFLYHAIHAGLDMGIVNPAQLSMYDNLDPALRKAAEDVILAKDSEAAERLLSIAANIAAEPEDPKELPAWRKESLDRRIAGDLIRGDDSWLKSDMDEAVACYGNAVKIIEGPLMNGMKEAGSLFAAGKMFLPQVVKTARVMKAAVDILLPFMNAETNSSAASAGTVILATVKGDVHDIGKNIVSVVLRCNNYNVIDLGVMVPANVILDAAEKHKADAVCLSGLITPSLAEMAFVASEMERRKMCIPLLVGGATTSALHTALKIQPLYSGPVIHTADASQDVPALNALLNPDKRDEFLSDIHDKYAELRRQNDEKNAGTEFISPEDALNNRTKIAFSPVSLSVQDSGVFAPPVKDLADRFNWEFFFHIWKVAGSSCPCCARKSLKQDAEAILNQMMSLPGYQPKALYKFFPACSKDNSILLYDKQGVRIAELPMFRRMTKVNSGANKCLADYVVPESAGFRDPFGIFVLTAGTGLDSLLKNADEYSALLIHTISNVLAEDLAETLHQYLTGGKGIRPVPGYPVCPDHTLKGDIFRLLNPEDTLKVDLLDSFMIDPASSVAGFLILRPEAEYFSAGPQPESVFTAYAEKRGIVPEKLQKFIAAEK